jgi:hypothetical protein
VESQIFLFDQMGAGASQEDTLCGFQVIKAQPGSPGAKAGLIPFFDYIVAANGIRLVQEIFFFFFFFHF